MTRTESAIGAPVTLPELQQQLEAFEARYKLDTATFLCRVSDELDSLDGIDDADEWASVAGFYRQLVDEQRAMIPPDFDLLEEEEAPKGASFNFRVCDGSTTNRHFVFASG